jgi:hypothetical protein
MIKALDTQIGGGHYKSLAIQPIEYIFHNNLNFLQANIVKYATRYKVKNGKEDLEKVIHYAQLLIDFEYGDVSYDAPSELGRHGPGSTDRDPT